MDWLIAAPVWGRAYAHRFLGQALPSIRAALDHAGVRARWIVHTDHRDALDQAMAGLDVAFRAVPGEGDLYRRFGDAHRDALASAPDGAAVALLTADIVVSRETFAACETRFAAGRRAVVAAATRTLAPVAASIGAASAELLDWTMRHPHPMVRACFWGQGDGPEAGRSSTPWAVYFRESGRTILRGLHLHPLAVVKDRPLAFDGTLDQGLLDRFARHEIHCVTDRDELAMAELSPADRNFSLRRRGEAMTAASIADWARTHARPVHWWLSTHRIVIEGDAGPTADIGVWRQVLASPHAPDTAEREMPDVRG